MRRQKAMGRSGGNRSTHQSYSELKEESLRRFYAASKSSDSRFNYLHDDPVDRRDAARWNCLVQQAFRIKYLPGDLKDRAETFYLLNLQAHLAFKGVR